MAERCTDGLDEGVSLSYILGDWLGFDDGMSVQGTPHATGQRAKASSSSVSFNIEAQRVEQLPS